MPVSRWTEAATERFKDLVEAKQQSFAGISAIMCREFNDAGFTRSACIAKSKHMAGVIYAPPVRKKPRKKVRSPKARVRTTAAPSKPLDMSHFEPLPLCRGVTLARLGRQMCKWPHGEGDGLRYCGAATDEAESFCPHHRAVAYRPRVAA